MDSALSGSCSGKLNKLALDLPLVNINGWTHSNSWLLSALAPLTVDLLSSRLQNVREEVVQEISSLCDNLFADLLSLHLVTFLMFFILVDVTFLAVDACLSWSLPSITEQQVSPHRLPMQYWLKNHRLSSNSPSTPTVFLIQQSCAIITFRC